MFQLVSEIHCRSTRHTSKPLNLVKPKPRLEIRKNFFSVRRVDKWNGLPSHIQNIADMVEFEIAYDKFTLNS